MTPDQIVGWAVAVLALIAWALQRATQVRTRNAIAETTARVRDELAHDVTPIIVAHDPQMCRRCQSVYDRETAEGLAAAERFANGGEVA